MKKALAFLLLLGAVIGMPASASAAPSVSVEFNDGVLWDDCFQVPITLSVAGDNPPAIRYEATVSLRDPAGFREEIEADLGFAYDDVTLSGSVQPGGVASIRTAQAEMCGFEGAGTWRANVTVHFFDGGDNQVGTATGTDTAEFRERLSTTTLTRSRGSKTFVIHVSAEIPGGSVAACRHCFTRLQRAKGTKWKTVAKGQTSNRGVFRTGHKPSKGLYRAVTPSGAFFFSSNGPSQSATFRVG